MSQRLNILIIEDTQDDVELMTRTLEKAGFAPNVHVVDDIKALEDSLKSQDWDVILSDYNLPSFNGIQALETAQSLKPEIPFFVVSGAIGEEKAVDLMRSGARDFVSKSNLKRLAPAIQRELGTRQKAKSLQKELIRTLETMSEGFISYDSEWRITFTNSETEKFAQTPRSQLVGKRAPEVFASPDWTKFQNHFERIILSGQAGRFEDTYQGRFLQVHAYPTEGRGISVFYRDVTAQKQAQQQLEENERLLDQIFAESSMALSFIQVPDLTYGRVNKKYVELVGERDFIGKKVFDVVPEAATQGFRDLLQQVSSDKKTIHVKEKLVTLNPPAGPEKQVVADMVYQPLLKPDGSIYGIISQITDVTEKVRAQREIEKAKQAVENERENFRNLFKQTPEMVCILKGPRHVFEFVNEAHVRVLGFDATGKSVFDAQPESVEVHGLLDQVYRTGKTAELFEIPVTVTNRLRYFNLTYAARRDADGHINGVMILGTEVTSEVLSRNAILEAQERLQFTLESGQMGTWELDLKSNQTLVSSKAAAILGYEHGRDDTSAIMEKSIHPEDLEQATKALREAIEQKKAYSDEFRIIRRDGKVRWIFSRGSLSFDLKGHPVFMSGIIMDITDRKNTALEIAESRERYKVLFDMSPNPKWIFDVETFQILEVNRTAVERYGYSRDEFLSMRVTELRPQEEVEKFMADQRAALSSGSVNLFKNYRHIKKDGTIVHVEVSSVDLIFQGRRARLAAIVDVTDRIVAEQKQAELLNSLKTAIAEAQSAREEAEKANELKSAFLANMSHEIRTPLGAMIGFADLLRDESLSTEERTSFINIMIKNGNQLAHLINDILDLSKVESGHLAIEKAEVNPGQIVDEVVSLLSVKAREKAVLVSAHIDASVPSQIISDPLRLRQILTNVIGNAIKFTPVGNVRVRISSPRHQEVHIEVSDTGIGIPEKDIEKLFQVFRQADESVSRKYGGTGLGLALSRKLAQALGGNVVLQKTERNRGSTFLITIKSLSALGVTPALAVEDLRDLSEQSLELSGVNILLVEDAHDNRELIWRILSKRGAALDIALNGLEGVEKALNGKHDLVLMDIQMPHMDGYTATQKLRDQGFNKPIIALTAHAMSEVRLRCLDVGCNDHLTKPIDSSELVKTVYRYSVQNRGSSTLQ